MPSVLLAVTFAAVTAASDWPCFLGPNRNATSDETGLVREFPENGPPILWTHDIGPGYGGVSVRDGEVYLHDRITSTADVLRVFDLETGEELWTYENEAPGRLQFAGSRCVPTVEDELVYLMGGHGDLICVDRALHEEVWSVDLVEDYDGSDPGYGWCQAPLIHEDLVIVAPMTDDVLLLAVDRFSGEEVWSTEGAGMSHSTPMLFELGGTPQVVYLSASTDLSGASSNPFGIPAPSSDRSTDSPTSRRRAPGMPPTETFLSSFLPDDGQLLWKSQAYHSFYPIPVPIQVDDTHLFLTSGYTSGSALMRIEEDGGDYTVEQVFHHPRGSQVHIPVRVGDHLYYLANENDNHERRRRQEGGLCCIDLEGNEMWRTGDQPFFGRGSVLLADGMLIIQDGFSGILRLVEPTPEEYRPIAEANIFGVDDRRDHGMWAPLALANGRLLMRSQEQLKCVDLRARKQ